MRLGFWLAALALALGSAGVGRAAAVCQMQELGELPVVTDRSVPLIDTVIDGEAVRMIVDTGSSGTMLTRAAAVRKGLALRQQTGVRMYGVGGEDAGDSARIKEFRVGNLVARDFDMLVSGRTDLGEAKGLLGALFLLQTDVEFDLPDSRIRFFRPKDCHGDQVVYWGQAYAVTPIVGSNPGEVEVTVRLNGRTVFALMDSGSSSSVVTSAVAANLGVRAAAGDGSPTNAFVGMGAHKVISFLGTFQTFAFGDETIHNARLWTADLFADDKEAPLDSHIAKLAVDEPDMLLGADFFRSHRVYISLSQRKVYVTYVGGPVFSRPAAATGSQ